MGTEPKVAISKLEVVQRHLEYAVFAIYRDDDPVPVHTIIMTAFWQLDETGVRTGNPVAFQLMKGMLTKEGQDVLFEKLRSWFNAFRHNNRKGEPQEFELFDPTLNELMLFMAIDSFTRLGDQRPAILMGYSQWFILRNPHLLADDFPGKKIVAKLSAALRALPDHAAKKLALASLLEANGELDEARRLVAQLPRELPAEFVKITAADVAEYKELVGAPASSRKKSV